MLGILLSISAITLGSFTSVSAYTTIDGTTNDMNQYRPHGSPKSSPNCAVWTKKALKFGVRDSEGVYDVASLQNFLIEKGYMGGTATGFFGVNTMSAVKKFQKNAGIDQVGYLGPQTRAKLMAESCEKINPILPAICSYPAPPTGCNYIEGTNFNSQTNCGLVLSCTKPVILN